MRKSRLLVMVVLLYFASLSFPLLYCSAVQEELSYQEDEAMKYLQEDKPRRHFVSKLYKAGAIYIGVIKVMGDVAGVKVYLPLDSQVRAGIFKVANEVLIQSGFRTEEDTGQDILNVWFR